jgi:hypothetical protein
MFHTCEEAYIPGERQVSAQSLLEMNKNFNRLSFKVDTSEIANQIDEMRNHGSEPSKITFKLRTGMLFGLPVEIIGQPNWENYESPKPKAKTKKRGQK